jgi:hypothetical protein
VSPAAPIITYNNKLPQKNIVNMFSTNKTTPVCINYSAYDINILLNHIEIVEQFLSEFDKTKRQELLKKLELIIPQQLDLIYLRFYIFNFQDILNYHYATINVNPTLFIQLYHYLYKYILNN